MPRHDPIPAQRAAQPPALRDRFMRVFKVLALLALIIGALSAAIIGTIVDGLPIHMLIATALGTGFTVLVGGGLMTLVFLSASSGHDSDAAATPNQENE